MAKMERIAALQAKMRKVMSRYAEASVVTGYTASYAVYVHENTQMKLKGQPRNKAQFKLTKAKVMKNGKLVMPKLKRLTEKEVVAKNKKFGLFWDPQGQGQAKFLEAPARYLKAVLAEIIVKAMKSGAPMAKALLLAGLRLQRESQLLVPVDTGNLKNSAFTRIESGNNGDAKLTMIA